MSSQLCSEVNGGSCKNKVSARNGYICAAGHSGNGVARPAVSISKMKQRDKEHLARSTEDEPLQWELFRAGNPSVQWYLATNPSIDEALQLELFRTGHEDAHYKLASNPSISEAIQWKLFRTGHTHLQQCLAGNPSIDEALQLELFRTGHWEVQKWLALNPSIGRNIAIELAKVGEAPHGYTRNKPLAELVQPESLALLGQYPRAFGRAYLYRLLNNPQEDKEESKALTLHSYFIYEKSGARRTKTSKNEILERYADDQEVALIISTEPAQ